MHGDVGFGVFVHVHDQIDCVAVNVAVFKCSPNCPVLHLVVSLDEIYAENVYLLGVLYCIFNDVVYSDDVVDRGYTLGVSSLGSGYDLVLSDVLTESVVEYC